MTTRVLFVDDESNILQALRRALRGLRGEWDISFADGGAAALEVLEGHAFDAVVTDMRMPGMDGAELLAEVVRRQPQSIRFVLSGEADRQMTYRTMGVSHRFLPKPCDTETLIDGLRDCLKRKDAIGNPAIQTAVAATASLVTPADHASDVRGLFDQRKPSLDDIAAAMSRDPALSAKLLQLANSAYFGVGKAVGSPMQAAQLIGLEILADLVRDHGLMKRAQAVPDTHRECLRVAQGAQAIARRQGLSETDIDHAYTAGLLHLLGQIILASHVSCEQTETPDKAVNHADVGAYLAGLWGLPRPIVEAIAHQNVPGQADAGDLRILPALHAAMGISKGLERHESKDAITAALDTDFLDASGVIADLPVWIEGCAEAWGEAEVAL